MRGGASVRRRTAHLVDGAWEREWARQAVALRAEVERVAAEVGMDPAFLLGRAEEMVARARAAGARSEVEVDAFARRELGRAKGEPR